MILVDDFRSARILVLYLRGTDGLLLLRLVGRVAGLYYGEQPWFRFA
jgi:hypothetical protein